MPAPIFRLPATGVDPKVTTKQLLENNVNAVLSALYGEIATIATGLNPRGGWDASSGAFPSGSKKGDYWIVSDAGTMDGQGFIVGDWVVALVNNASTSTYAENWFRADYSTVTPKEYPTIADLALADDAIDDMTKAVVDGFNGEREYFTFVAGSTLTADGALVVDGVGGQWVSKRTVYENYDDMVADVRAFDDGTQLQAEGRLFEFLSIGGNIETGGGTVNEIGQVPSIRNDINALALRSTVTRPLSDPIGVVANPITTNKWNPDVSDVGDGGDAAPAIGSTTGNQLHRLRGNTSGTLSAQNATSLWSFWASRKTPVLEPSTEYTISIHGAPGGAYFYTIGYLQFFNPDGSLHSYITSGFTVTPAGNPREITFTTPAASVSIAPNMRNVTDFSVGNPVTADHVDIVSEATMLNKGGSALDYTEYSDGTFTPTSSIFDTVSVGDVAVSKQGDYLYSKTGYQQDDTKSLLSCISYGLDPNPYRTTNANGVVDTQGQRIAGASIPKLGVIAAFNQSDSVVNSGFDEGAPDRINGMYLGGAGHGVVGVVQTMASHGKTEDDVGSLWYDGVSSFVLQRIKSTSQIIFTRLYSGDEDKWSISTATPASLTFTHVSGATNTANIVATATAQAQGFPITRNYTSEVSVDGVAITSDGETKGERLKISEYYEVMNAAKQQDYLTANAGTTPVDYTNGSIDTQFSKFNEHTFTRNGALSGRSAMSVKNAFRRALSVDYTGFFQRQRLSLVGDSVVGMSTTVHLYVPDMSATVAGYDFQAIADITENATEVRVPRTSCTDPDDPASHFCMIGKDGSGNVVANMLFGYDRTYGLGVPATRAANVNDVMFFSSAEKLYPIAIDAAAGDAAAGDLLEAGWFVVPFAPDPTGDLTVPGIIVEIGNRVFCYITAHKSLTGKRVAIEGYDGRAVSIIKSHANVTVSDAYVSNGGLTVSVTGGYGDVVLELI